LKIAEVASRIQDKNAFIKSVEKIGFKLVSNQVISQLHCNKIFPLYKNLFFHV